VIEYIGIALSLADKLMDRIPDYEEKKREHFYKLRRKYEREVSKDRQYRSDLRVDEYATDLKLFIEHFITQIPR